MKRIVITAGLACALAAPGVALAQSGSGSAGQSTRPKKPAVTTQGSGQSGQASTGTGQAASAKSGALAATDKRFILEAAGGGMAEVEFGRLAAEKASNAEVKQFGQRMVDDHSKANDELKSLASQKNVSVPADLDAKHKATRDRLSKLSGEAFDRAYMREMVTDHNKDVAEFQRVSKTARDGDLKAFAAKTLPTLQEHQKMAKEINGKVGGGAAASKATTKKEPKK